MRVGVGYCDNPDSATAAATAVGEAAVMAGKTGPCDLVLLFATATHDAAVLDVTVRALTGGRAPIVGGGAVGAISNRCLGYAGDQVGVALIWFEGASCDILAEPGLDNGETETGVRLGRRLAERGAGRETPVLLLYDGIDRSHGDLRLLMATPLLDGIRKGAGVMPNLVGACLMGDYASTPVQQWNGTGRTRHEVVALTFGGGVRLDFAIMHGCRPATGYYTVTKADRQIILEINHQPALPFIERLLGPGIASSEYAFFLTFGINQGDRWGEFVETDYANRLCLSVDRERNGIVMFEPDMVEGTRFQLMHRSLDLEYMEPKIRGLFASLNGRKPVFALYIDCAGRAAGHSGTDLEDAAAVQRLSGDVPLLGLYSGVEIAPVRGESRALDWTGVYCLLSEADD